MLKLNQLNRQCQIKARSDTELTQFSTYKDLHQSNFTRKSISSKAMLDDLEVAIVLGYFWLKFPIETHIGKRKKTALTSSSTLSYTTFANSLRKEGNKTKEEVNKNAKKKKIAIELLSKVRDDVVLKRR